MPLLPDELKIVDAVTKGLPKAVKALDGPAASVGPWGGAAYLVFSALVQAGADAYRTHVDELLARGIDASYLTIQRPGAQKARDFFALHEQLAAEYADEHARDDTATLIDHYVPLYLLLVLEDDLMTLAYGDMLEGARPFHAIANDFLGANPRYRTVIREIGLIPPGDRKRLHDFTRRAYALLKQSAKTIQRSPELQRELKKSARQILTTLK